jgi:hypothetical protein
VEAAVFAVLLVVTSFALSTFAVSAFSFFLCSGFLYHFGLLHLFLSLSQQSFDLCPFAPQM